MRGTTVFRVVVAFALASLIFVQSSHTLLLSDVMIAAERPGGLSAWASTAPMIDGKLTPSYFLLGQRYPEEWADARKMSFNLIWGVETHDASLYVMNDYVNLYIAFEIKLEDYDPTDHVWINFDNNDDNNKMTGDNALYLDAHSSYVETFAGRYEDGHWATEGEGYPSSDSLLGGTNDGVGACKFSGATLGSGNYTFEFAYPLNTGDDDHDFSLTVGDTVGFNILYMDSGGGPDSEAGWPTLTKVNWNEMATILIAGPEMPPPPTTLNLEIDSAEITQAVQRPDNSLPLVRGKSTIVRVYVDVFTLSWGVRNVEVYLYATVDGWTRALPGVFCSSNGPLRQSFDAPSARHRQHIEDSANFLLPDYWTQGSHVTLSAFLKAPFSQGESSYADNWMMFEGSPERTFTFKSTVDLTIHMVPFDVTWATPSQPTNEQLSQTEQYITAAYPVANIDFIRHEPFRWSGRSLDDAIEELNVQALDLGLSHPADMIFGLLPNSAGFTGTSDPDWDMAGYDGLGFAAAGCLAVTSQEGVMAHEFCHNLGPGTDEGDDVYRGWGLHTFTDADWPYLNNNTNEIGASADWGWPPLIMPNNKPDLMSYSTSGFFPAKWMSPYRWENLANRLDPPAAGSTLSIQQTGESLVVSGWISENGTGSLRSIFSIPEVPESPTGPSNISLILKDSTGGTLLTHSFGVRFTDLDGETYDPDYFTVVLPHMTGSHSVSLWNGTILLDQITASTYAPQVQVIAPNGGETVGDLFTIAWTASDLDEDPLEFKVFYSGDNGSSWIPVSPRLTETVHVIDASRLPGGSDSLIRVVASDGFHTSSDQSDDVFSVPSKAPLDVTCIGAGPCNLYNFGDLVAFRGSAQDPEDGVLQNSAFTWTSDINGFLGTGRVLTTTDLIPGTHNITLTVTDSDGNYSTSSYRLEVELHDVAATNGTPAKTIIGEGYNLTINVTAENLGLSNETLNVTLVMNRINISTVNVGLYGHATAGWGLDLSNMTSPGPTITAKQWDTVKLTLTSADSLPHNFFVDYNGDALPTLGEPTSPDFTSTITYQFVADTPGAFAYYCQYHSTMMFGTLIVGEPDVIEHLRETIEALLFTTPGERVSRPNFSTPCLVKGYYIIGVYAESVPQEIKKADNLFAGGVIYVGVPGDVDGNHIVNMLDLYRVALNFGKTAAYTTYEVANCDIEYNGIINMLDLYIAATHFGETDP